SGRSFETVAETADGRDVSGIVRLLLDLLAEAPHMDIDGARSNEPLLAPDGFQQLFAAVSPPGMGKEELQQIEFGRGEREFAAIHVLRASARSLVRAARSGQLGTTNPSLPPEVALSRAPRVGGGGTVSSCSRPRRFRARAPDLLHRSEPSGITPACAPAPATS